MRHNQSSLANTLPLTYTCPACGKEHRFHPWVYAHWQDRIEHICTCGVRNSIQQGKVTNVKEKVTP